MTATQLYATETWLEKTGEAEPEPATDYKWAWEYARFRLARATDRVELTESKALESIKLVLGSGAAAGIAVGFVRFSGDVSAATLGCLFVSLELWAAAAVYALRACLPARRLHLADEDAPLPSASDLRQAFEAMTKFRRTLAATEMEAGIATRKTGFVLFATGFLALAVVLLVLGVFLGVR